MSTPIIQNLIPSLRDTVFKHLRSYLGGEGELSSIQDSLEFWWDRLRDKEHPELPMWQDVPSNEQDQLFDEWHDAMEEFWRERLTVRGKLTPSSTPAACAPPHGTDVLPVAKFTHETVCSPGWYWFKSDFPGKGFSDRFVYLEEDSFDDGNKWLMGRNCQGSYFGPINLDAITSTKPVSVAPAASSAVPAPLVTEVVKEALEALETAKSTLCQMGRTVPSNSIAKEWCDHAEEECESALTALRSYTPVPSQSEELLREAMDEVPGMLRWAADTSARPSQARRVSLRLKADQIESTLSKLNSIIG